MQTNRPLICFHQVRQGTYNLIRQADSITTKDLVSGAYG
ncbi:hypothetical protein SAMN05444487_106171 [Marininema mesophilum]|uniref:Uncharacterized protein n=1 Tax=Marininema mesophilum TaxID=1048340 RepID=A0A1H2WLH1_9BACL|nr:hypothetical protein SAMN05444487_106171 [Marininema mesophilum]